MLVWLAHFVKIHQVPNLTIDGNLFHTERRQDIGRWKVEQFTWSVPEDDSIEIKRSLRFLST